MISLHRAWAGQPVLSPFPSIPFLRCTTNVLPEYCPDDPPRSSHPFGMPMIWHDIVAVRKLFVADSAFPVLLDDLPMQRFPHLCRSDRSSRYPLGWCASSIRCTPSRIVLGLGMASRPRSRKSTRGAGSIPCDGAHTILLPTSVRGTRLERGSTRNSSSGKRQLRFSSPPPLLFGKLIQSDEWALANQHKLLLAAVVAEADVIDLLCDVQARPLTIAH